MASLRRIGSIRELVDGTGAIRARYDYDPYGNVTKLSGDLDTDFAYTGHYHHAGTALHLAPYRAYDPALGRWLSRDPIGESGGINLYGYVANQVLRAIDPLGLAPNGPLHRITMRFSDGSEMRYRPETPEQFFRDMEAFTKDFGIRQWIFKTITYLEIEDHGNGVCGRGLTGDEKSRFEELARKHLAPGATVYFDSCEGTYHQRFSAMVKGVLVVTNRGVVAGTRETGPTGYGPLPGNAPKQKRFYQDGEETRNPGNIPKETTSDN